MQQRFLQNTVPMSWRYLTGLQTLHAKSSLLFLRTDFIQVNGGPQRIGIIIRASWICYGDTSLYKIVCPTPKAINPSFQKGDRVQIVLKKHLTDQWFGVIENSFFRPGLRSNVYGVRFVERGNLYTRYYESNLKKVP